MQRLRDASQFGNHVLAFRALAQVSGSRGCAISGEFAIQVGHEFFGLNRVHDLVHMASPSARVSFTLSTASLASPASLILSTGSRCPLNAIRDRNSRERTVFTGSFNSS